MQFQIKSQISAGFQGKARMHKTLKVASISRQRINHEECVDQAMGIDKLLLHFDHIIIYNNVARMIDLLILNEKNAL